MKAIIIIGIIMIVGGFIAISERLAEIEAHQRVIESMLDDLNKKLWPNIGKRN